jgi:hypothetical protein
MGMEAARTKKAANPPPGEALPLPLPSLSLLEAESAPAPS